MPLFLLLKNRSHYLPNALTAWGEAKGSGVFLYLYAQKTYSGLPVFLTREASRVLQPFRMPPFLFLDIPRYVIRVENMDFALYADQPK
jgi:hypothetical protein